MIARILAAGKILYSLHVTCLKQRCLALAYLAAGPGPEQGACRRNSRKSWARRAAEGCPKLETPLAAFPATRPFLPWAAASENHLEQGVSYFLHPANSLRDVCAFSSCGVTLLALQL